jgi:hypothetical protein
MSQEVPTEGTRLVSMDTGANGQGGLSFAQAKAVFGRPGRERVSNGVSGRLSTFHVARKWDSSTAKNGKQDRLEQTNPILRQLTNPRWSYDESENPFMWSVRSATDTIGTLFDENETAQAMRILRMEPELIF